MFRPSATRDDTRNLVKTLAQTAVFWLVFLVVLPYGLLQLEGWLGLPSFAPWEVVGSGLLVGFSGLGLYSGYTMSQRGKGTPLPLDCPNELVVAGPYRWVRNPMAVAGIGQGVCVGLLTGSYLVVGYALAGALLWHVVVRPVEERDLADRFGEAYGMYRSRVRCWWPRFVG